jgi:hypothetical protein
LRRGRWMTAMRSPERDMRHTTPPAAAIMVGIESAG